MSGDESAFPNSNVRNHADRIELQSGLTKRELFASMAMQGMLSTPHPEIFREMVKLGGESFGYVVAKTSIEAADALIAELESK